MSQQPENEPFSDSHLESREYRERLMRKLNCLIAVLEVATAKVRKSLAGPSPDVERLKRIQMNLQSTLEVCIRARTALEKRDALPKDLPENLSKIVGMQVEHVKKVDVPRPAEAGMPLGAHVEMSSSAEREKFERMGQIESDEIDDVDWDLLSRQLQF